MVGVSRGGKDRHPGRERDGDVHTLKEGTAKRMANSGLDIGSAEVVGWPFLTLRYSGCFVVIILVE